MAAGADSQAYTGPDSKQHSPQNPETPPGPLPKGNAPQGSQTPGPTPDPPCSRARQCPKPPGASTSTPTPTPAPEGLPPDTGPTTPIRRRRKPHNTKNGRKQASAQHLPPHCENPSTQMLLPRKVNMPALPGDRQARRTGIPPAAHRRHAGARAAPTDNIRRPIWTNRRHQPSPQADSPTQKHNETTPPPPTTANTAARQSKGQSSPTRRTPESQSSKAAPAAGTSSKKKAADAPPPPPPRPARKPHDPPRSGPAPPTEPSNSQASGRGPELEDDRYHPTRELPSGSSPLHLGLQNLNQTLTERD
ncbi:PREDICTED: vegetative cell wall protein gp1-like [Cyprinodon variegatus]|uniref:vegetative cell wall protein gp1-like n=1 Tax=Cyprinodon variegatus TaxID=28743 RepID=UPI000742A1CD|nr:PREDICTED: vegetative cell wall protein gp1-like [Cyprinodon variegatus]